MSNLGNKEIMAKNIRYYMDKYDKTRQEMCDALGVKYTTFTDWVKGNSYPRIDKIELMANYFGISKADLVEDHNDMQQSEMPYYLNDETCQIAKDAFENLEFLNLAKNYRAIPNDMQQRLTAYATKLRQLYDAEELLNAAHERTDISDSERTKEAKKAEEDIMDDPNF